MIPRNDPGYLFGSGICIDKVTDLFVGGVDGRMCIKTFFLRSLFLLGDVENFLSSM